METKAVYGAVEAESKWIAERLRALVEVESPSDDKAAVDGAAALVGSIGLIPSMSLGAGPSLYEPIHGSAPTLAGKDVACPIGSILSAAMLLGESLGLRTEAAAVESALDHVLERGFRTADIAEPSGQVIGCARFGELLNAELGAALKQESARKADA